MTADPQAKSLTIPLGVVIRRQPGVTRWATTIWRAVAVLPGAAPAEWRLLREDGEAAEFHAATLPLTLWRTDVEAYRVSLGMAPPSVFVVLRPGPGGKVEVHRVTASAYEAQDYTDSGEEIVEPVPMPEALAATIDAFCQAHPEEAPFVKRRRDRMRLDHSEDGKGDARIRQTADVYRAPGALKPGRRQ